LKTGV